MIEISHKQAIRLISRQLDLLLTDEDWNALQNHLEHCPTCRNGYNKFHCAERKLSQSLRARWDPVAGPSRRLPQIVSLAYRERAARRISLTTEAFLVALFSLILLLAAVHVPGGGIPETIPQISETENSPTPVPSPTQHHARIPLIQPGQFPHMVAYESQTEGNAEIYLLNPGFSPVNLTQNPAEDTFPTWSPDGEWLAFLSNRAAPNQKISKNELYVVSIAGNQLFQLTSEPRVDWNGPLSWSGDGKWIALAGVLRDEPRQQSIYVVGVDGSGVRQLPNTQGGETPKFAPYGDRLAFHQMEGDLNRLVIYHIVSGLITFENIPQSNQSPNVPIATAVNAAFDWPADGDGLYYAAAITPTHFIQPDLTPECSWIIIQQIPNDEAWFQKLRDHFHMAGREITGMIHNIGWAPKELVVYTTDLQGQDSVNTGCNTEENCSDLLDFLVSKPGPSYIARFFTDLCVQSELDRGSWSLDMRWFIFTAYEQGAEDMGLYAVRMPGMSLSWQLSGMDNVQNAAIPAGNVFRLSPVSIQSSLPRVRPFRTRMNIEPRNTLWPEKND